MHSSNEDFADAMTQQNATPRVYVDLQKEANTPTRNKKQVIDYKKKLRKTNVFNRYQ